MSLKRKWSITPSSFLTHNMRLLDLHHFCFGGTFLAAERTHFDNVFVVAFFKHDFAVGWQALCGLVQISLCFAFGTEGFQINKKFFVVWGNNGLSGGLAGDDLFNFNVGRALVLPLSIEIEPNSAKQHHSAKS